MGVVIGGANMGGCGREYSIYFYLLILCLWGHLAVMDEDDKSFLYSKSEESEERRVEANYSTIPLTNKYTQHTLIGDVSLKGQWRE